MATDKQILGDFGENLVARYMSCPKCKREKTLKKLPPNFKCADLICDFCGYLAQVKSKNVSNIDIVPKQILGASWKPQKERMDAGLYFPLFLVLVEKENNRNNAIYYLSADLQVGSLFVKRKPLKDTAKRAGWQGFYYDMDEVKGSVIRVR